jgi:hypothetical protein
MSSEKFAIADLGSRLSATSGIVELMEDLGQAMGGRQRGTMRMLGGGNRRARVVFAVREKGLHLRRNRQLTKPRRKLMKPACISVKCV